MDTLALGDSLKCTKLIKGDVLILGIKGVSMVSLLRGMIQRVHVHLCI